jgi:hypothetical protein
LQGLIKKVNKGKGTMSDEKINYVEVKSPFPHTLPVNSRKEFNPTKEDLTFEFATAETVVSMPESIFITYSRVYPSKYFLASDKTTITTGSIAVKDIKETKKTVDAVEEVDTVEPTVEEMEAKLKGLTRDELVKFAVELGIHKPFTKKSTELIKSIMELQ